LYQHRKNYCCKAKKLILGKPFVTVPKATNFVIVLP
jgi:hypothetical protein